MNICHTTAHGEIVHHGNLCEVCETIKDLQAQINFLLSELKDAQRALQRANEDLGQ